MIGKEERSISMGIMLVKENDNVKKYVKEVFVSTLSDKDNIDVSIYSPGSVCTVLNVGRVFVLNNEKQWEELAPDTDD
jgi:hypothetical protein